MDHRFCNANPSEPLSLAPKPQPYASQLPWQSSSQRDHIPTKEAGKASSRPTVNLFMSNLHTVHIQGLQVGVLHLQAHTCTLGMPWEPPPVQISVILPLPTIPNGRSQEGRISRSLLSSSPKRRGKTGLHSTSNSDTCTHNSNAVYYHSIDNSNFQHTNDPTTITSLCKLPADPDFSQ